MKIGDEVRFLNARGGGIVKGFQGKDIVLVEDETGFELPVLIKECIVISSGNEEQVRQATKPTAEIQHLARTEQPEEKYEFTETKEGESLSVYIAYLPNDIKNLSQSTFDCFLINDSNYHLSFNYMSHVNNGWVSRVHGTIEPNTKLFLEEFDWKDLNDIEKTCLQFISYKLDKPYSLKNAISQEIRIDTTKFYKLHSFKENDFFDEVAIVYTVLEKDKGKKDVSVSAKELQEAMMSKDQPKQREKRQRLERKEKDKVIEIDLHAHEVLENTAGLSNTDILEYQLNIFREVMNENKKKKGQRIVFIHGKGEGVLKNAIATELKKHYKSALSQDASFQEYGFGATMVTIK